MRKYTKLLIIVGLLGLAAGCANVQGTRIGSLCLVDLDLRTAEQLIAARSNPPTPVTVAVVTPWYSFVPAILDMVKGRVRVLAIDWYAVGSTNALPTK